jgi:hypothetical protein
MEIKEGGLWKKPKRKVQLDEEEGSSHDRALLKAK